VLVDTDNLVTADEFRKNLAKYAEAARAGHGPVAVTQDAKVIGFWVDPGEYEALVGLAVKDLLDARAKGPTVSHEEARERIQDVLRRVSAKKK
jgi:PHD/YefM family antitoxin component YafN of YafNO toxin-antitoxin module